MKCVCVCVYEVVQNSESAQNRLGRKEGSMGLDAMATRIAINWNIGDKNERRLMEEGKRDWLVVCKESHLVGDSREAEIGPEPGGKVHIIDN